MSVFVRARKCVNGDLIETKSDALSEESCMEMTFLVMSYGHH